ncbi:DUF3592 domain-containing protein [Streptomyces sp. NPDC058718]|uniref:DUF3592 domain-containing protein n=1 Tax=Streptomyces sp. NPDC058718 TaxID=3346610 RepID=UPI003688914F
MDILVGLLAVICAALLLWVSWLVTRKGVRLFRETREALRGTAGVVGTCVSSGTSRHLYRFTTPDGVNHHAYVARTSDDDRRKVGSRARLRYRTNDPKFVSFAVVDLVAMPVVTTAAFLLAAALATSGLVLICLVYAGVTDR